MEVVRRLALDCEPGVVFSHLDDLAHYPAWMDLVHAVELVDAGPTWNVELRAQVGPFARSKRLRMQRIELEPDRLVVFERREADGRDHSPWTLRAELSSLNQQEISDEATALTELTMTLTYGGNLWAGAVLQRVLDDKVAAGSAALRALVES